MMINGLWNRRIGPGGGTRRLHQENYGDEIGSTGVIKMGPFIRHSTTVSGLKKIDVAANARREEEVVVQQDKISLVIDNGSVKMFNANTFTGTPSVVANGRFEETAAAA